ncbi:WD repeat-containing protein 6 [Chamberlinius hualienensis]
MCETSRLTTATRFRSLPITCLELIEGLLCAGEGPHIRLYRRNADSSQWVDVGHYAVFKSVNVHGMKIGTASADIRKICVFGGKCVRIIEITLRPDTVLKCISPILTFQDWIWDASWFSLTRIVFIMAQNYVVLWDSSNDRSIKKFQCETKCILYCGIFVGSDWTTGMALSGTVFQEVLIWSPADSLDKEDFCPVIHRLLGHEGVIFAIHYNEAIRKLCTASDDRSVHVWNHNISPELSNLPGKLTVSDWKSSSFSLIGKLFGHESRVCKAKIFHNYCISAGEDSMLCFWKYDIAGCNYKLDRKISCHAGSAIRSICVDEETNKIITGGDDSGIKMWPSWEKHNENACDEHVVLLNNEFALGKELPRELKLLDDEHMLILTDLGRLLCYNLVRKEIQTWLENIKVKSENVIDICLHPEKISLVAFGDLNGKVTVLKTFYCDSTLKFEQIGQFLCCSGKVFTVKWVEQSHLLTCGMNGQMGLWHIKEMNNSIVSNLVAKLYLPSCKHQWVSAAKLLTKYNKLICGSRGGSVYLYEVPTSKDRDEVVQSCQCFPRLHGSHGVSSIFVSDETKIIYTTGRDGTMTTFELDSNSLNLLHKIRVPGCPKWISGIVHRESDLLVFGFHDERFILWSERHQTVLSEIYCGGGHRSWDIYFRGSTFIFTYIKEGDIGVVTKDLKFILPTRIKFGNHIRQINHVYHLFIHGSKSYFATGSEDNSIKIWSVNMEKSVDDVVIEHSLRGHISSVKTISSCLLPSSTDKRYDYLLVTAGGRAQIICWKLSFIIDENVVNNIKITAQHLLTYMLNPNNCKSRKPWEDLSFTIDPETRIMDSAVWKVENYDNNCSDSVFIIAIACSDSYIRYYSYQLNGDQMTLWVQHTPHGDHCILKLNHSYLYNYQKSVVITTATDGHAVIFDATQLERRIMDFEAELLSDSTLYVNAFAEDKLNELELLIQNAVVNKIQLNQSGITCMAVQVQEFPDGIGQLILTCGGDDTALNLVTLHFKAKTSEKLQFHKIDRAIVTEAHSAQITGVNLITPSTIVTTSVDQRIKIWSSSSENTTLSLVSSSFSNVADTSSMTTWSGGEHKGRFICVVGKGIGVYELTSCKYR